MKNKWLKAKIKYQLKVKRNQIIKVMDRLKKFLYFKIKF